MASSTHKKGWGIIAVSSMVAIALIVLATVAMLFGLFLQAYGRSVLLGLFGIAVIALIALFVYSASDPEGNI